MLGFSACDSDDRDNVLVMPAADSFTLQTPDNASAEWYLEKGNSFELTASQPDYGKVGPIQYSVQVAIDDQFEKVVSLNPADNSTNEMKLSETDLNVALNQLYGFDYETWEDLGFVPVYMRACASLSGNASTMLYSNSVTYSQVAFYRPSPDTTGEPTGIYLRGGMNGWGAEEAWEFVTTSDANITMLYNVTISAGTEFKVAAAEWSDFDFGGSKAEDAPALEFGVEFPLEAQGANIKMPVDFTGNIQLIEKRGEYSLYLEVTDSSVGSGIFLRGDMNGWGATSEYEFRSESSFSNVYYIDGVKIAAGEQFKFASEDWSTVDLGGDGSSPVFGVDYPLARGGANITLDQDFTGTIILTKDGENYTAMFEVHLPGEPSGIYLLGGMNGWSADSAWEFVTTASKTQWELNGVTIEAGTEFKIATPDWSTVNLGADEMPFELGTEYTLVTPGGNIPMPETATVNITLTLNGDVYTVLVTKQ